MSPSRAGSGFTLLEVMIATLILTIGALMLSASIASSRRMTNLARERAVANGAVRTYIERIRAAYPPAGFPKQGSSGMQYLLADQTTPLDDLNALAASGVERSVLRNAIATVYMTTDETGAIWTFGRTTDPAVAPLASAISAEDRAALSAPRDLDGDGSRDNAGSPARHVPSDRAAFVPAKIEISWTSGSGDRTDAATPRQRLTVYAAFGPQH